MLNTDDFIMIVPRDGRPKLLRQGEDLSAYVDQSGYVRLNKTVALKDGQSVQGSVIRLRDTTAADEIDIMDLLNRVFRKPRVGEHLTLPSVDGPGTVPPHQIERVHERIDRGWLVEANGGRVYFARSDMDDQGNHVVWLGEAASSR